MTWGSSFLLVCLEISWLLVSASWTSCPETSLFFLLHSCSDDGHLCWVLVLDLPGVDDVHVSCPLLYDDHDCSGGDHVDALLTLHGPCEDPVFLPWLPPWLSSL